MPFVLNIVIGAPKCEIRIQEQFFISYRLSERMMSNITKAPINCVIFYKDELKCELLTELYECNNFAIEPR